MRVRGWCLGTESFREELLGQMAERLRAGTVQWIAARLRMGTLGYVPHPLDRRRKAEGQ